MYASVCKEYVQGNTRDRWNSMKSLWDFHEIQNLPFFPKCKYLELEWTWYQFCMYFVHILYMKILSSCFYILQIYICRYPLLSSLFRFATIAGDTMINVSRNSPLNKRNSSPTTHHFGLEVKDYTFVTNNIAERHRNISLFESFCRFRQLATNGKLNRKWPGCLLVLFKLTISHSGILR